jgi:hypothetical protein
MADIQGVNASYKDPLAGTWQVHFDDELWRRLWCNHCIAVAMFLACALTRGLHTPENIQNGRHSRV